MARQTPIDRDALFRRAVAAIDAGDVALLEQLLSDNPALATERLESPGEWLRSAVGKALDGFFSQPYLLWFVAEDPVRNGRLPANVADAARTIIAAARRANTSNIQEQLDYAISLVSWSWIARESGVQIALLDVLIDAGAALDGNPGNALVNGNVAAAAHLVARGAPLTLGIALGLERWSDAERLAKTASADEKQFALVLSALNGNAEAVRRAIAAGANLDAPAKRLYTHATPLHHAVSSGSLDAVRVLLDAGAKATGRDTAWDGTPLGWAEHYIREGKDGAGGRQYGAIRALLRERGSAT